MVIWSERAKADFRSIHDFIAHNSKHYAEKNTQGIVPKTDILSELSRIGRVVLQGGITRGLLDMHDSRPDHENWLWSSYRVPAAPAQVSWFLATDWARSVAAQAPGLLL